MCDNQESVRQALKDIGDAAHVMVLSTARRHARGIQRLPDRVDRGRRVVAVQVETERQAQDVLAILDRVGRVLYLDVERKQDLHLMRVARDVVTLAEVRQIKPNDLTVDALFALLVDRLGPDLSDLPITVLGTGNLGFKFAVRLAESGSRVALEGRDPQKVDLLVRAINAVVPENTPHPVVAGRLPGSRILVSAVTAEAVVQANWLATLSKHALCIDVGIGNFSPEFIEGAIAASHECVRLDVRSGGDPLPLHPNPFFQKVAGRREIAETTIVAGGLIGRYGELVVDQVEHPTSVVGVANGTGGLLPYSEWTEDVQISVSSVRARIAHHDIREQE